MQHAAQKRSSSELMCFYIIFLRLPLKLRKEMKLQIFMSNRKSFPYIPQNKLVKVLKTTCSVKKKHTNALVH